MNALKPFIKKDLIWLTLLISVFFGFMLGSRPLSAPDEGRYTEIPREMALSQDYVTPRLNGVKYFEKPPLMYWLTSAAIKVAGVNEWTSRFWPALLGLLGCLSVYAFGARFFSRQAGIASALILSSNVLFYAHSRLMILDMGVTFFISLSLFAFLWATQVSSKTEQQIALSIFFISAACSTLTKGLIGIAIPGSIILLWVLFSRNYEALKLAFKPWGIALFLLLSGPWHLLAHIRNPEYSEFYFIREHFLRYLTPVHGRTQPLGFFVPIFLVGWFPWTGLLMWGLRDRWQILKSNPLRLFLIIWAGFIFIFFSLSNSKLIPYLLPVFPPLAVLLGHKIALSWEKNALPKWPIILTALFFAIIVAAIPIALIKQELWLVKELHPFIIAIMGVLSLSCISLLILTYRKRARLTFITVFLTGALLLPILNAAWPHLDRRSVKVLADKINHLKSQGDKVVAYGRYYQDLPPYVNQQIIVVGWQGELEFGMTVEDTSAWMMNKEQFLKVYNSLGRVYIVTRKEFVLDLNARGIQNLTPLAETEKDVLLTNQP